MACSVLHKDQTVANGIHVIQSYEAADAAARTALVLLATDVGKVVRQLDDESFWIITDFSPNAFVKMAQTFPGSGADRFSFAGNMQGEKVNWHTMSNTQGFGATTWNQNVGAVGSAPAHTQDSMGFITATSSFDLKKFRAWVQPSVINEIFELEFGSLAKTEGSTSVTYTQLENITPGTWTSVNTHEIDFTFAAGKTVSAGELLVIAWKRTDVQASTTINNYISATIEVEYT